jgi:uncharacterized membrane protein
MRSLLVGVSDSRREFLRTNLWLVPTLLVIAAVGLFLVTHALDVAAYNGSLRLPSWANSGNADGARQILTTIAAAVITVVGVVFSIILVALTLVSTQFGPRMLRIFIRDRGTQFTLGAFVSTFVYAFLVLVSIAPGPHGDFVPHLSVVVCLALVVGDLGMLIFFIDHIAKQIQLPQVIAGIARDLANAIDSEVAAVTSQLAATPEAGLSPTEVMFRLEQAGAYVPAGKSGYLQFYRYDTLVSIAAHADATIRLVYRPGHFVSEGRPIAVVWPPEAHDAVAAGFADAHVTGPHRTLTQDLAFAIDQLVEIAIRALSPAVNDTFTALTCIDWLGDSFCKITERWDPQRFRRDRAGRVRVITAEMRYDGLVERAFEKIRQAGRGMPAIMIRQLDALAKISQHTDDDHKRGVLVAQAEMIMRSCAETVPEPCDRADVERAYQTVVSPRP